ncbi:MAG TPA: hypothetical protein VFO91_12855 [Anaerolineales bacterium]|nr:hypothetical protein [Anaerolineales bacterium]
MTTNCVFPPELEDKQLLAHLDNPEASPEITRHLEQCPHCREKAQSLDRLQKRLTARLYRVSCPSSMELGEYHLRMLPAPQMLVVAQHVRGCPHCTREVAELEDFLEVLATEDSLATTAKVLIARLTGGQTEVAKPAVALRGEAQGPLIFEADGIVITLDVQSGPKEAVSIQGQVAADDQDQWTGAIIKMLQVDRSELTASLDDLGAFDFPEVRPGSLELRITSPYGIEVRIPNVDIAG